MKLSVIFSNLNKDWQLINMTSSHQIPSEAKQGLVELGWHQEKIKKVACYVGMYHAATAVYDSSIFVSPGHKEGDAKWYKDLAGLTIPNHTPGFLTKMLG